MAVVAMQRILLVQDRLVQPLHLQLGPLFGLLVALEPSRHVPRTPCGNPLWQASTGHPSSCSGPSAPPGASFRPLGLRRRPLKSPLGALTQPRFLLLLPAHALMVRASDSRPTAPLQIPNAAAPRPATPPRAPAPPSASQPAQPACPAAKALRQAHGAVVVKRLGDHEDTTCQALDKAC